MIAPAENAYEKLLAQSREIAVLSSCLKLLRWDQETYMPGASAEHRADQVALLAGLVHRRITEPGMGALLDEVGNSELVRDPDSLPAANLRELRRRYERRVRVPGALVEELARTTSLAHHAWADARKKGQFAAFRPWLEKIVVLKREQASCIGSTEHPYDALLDEYEPGETALHLRTLFRPLREALAELLRRIVDSGRKQPVSLLERRYLRAQQEEFGRRAAAAIGFDFQRGRLDVTAHPFCTMIGPADTRMTTRYDEQFFSEAFFGILHEAGHGIYDQGLDASRYGTPLGDAVSLGIHESQSRMWENLVGRSRAFWSHFFPLAQKSFPDALRDASADHFYAAVNDVRPSFIRVEADEVTYNLHIFLRFELEPALIDGSLMPADVPAAWNEVFQRDFGITPPDDARGCLQDVHWSGGSIGYFPTYTLGNLYASQFFQKAREDLGDLEAQFDKGQFEPLRQWLNEKIHRHGMRWRANRLVEVITGQPLSHEPLVAHLETKYGELYGL